MRGRLWSFFQNKLARFIKETKINSNSKTLYAICKDNQIGVVIGPAFTTSLDEERKEVKFVWISKKKSSARKFEASVIL